MSAGSGLTNLEEHASLAGLTANTTYHYRIVATNSNGTTDGADEVFYTTAKPLVEFKPVPTKKKFTSTAGKAVWLGQESGVDLECSKGSTAGEITSASTIGKTVIKFTGCVMFQGGNGPCPVHSTNTTTKGELKTEPLKGELGSVAKAQAASETGMLFETEANHELFALASAEAPCSLGGEAFEGSIAAEVSPTGKRQLTSDLTFATSTVPQGEKITEITVKRGAVKPKLYGLWFGSLTRLTQTEETTFEEALEIT